MLYYSTNGESPKATLKEVVTKGLAPDKGLYMPESLNPIGSDFYASLAEQSFHDIATKVARSFFGEDIPQEELNEIVKDTLNFDIPLVKVEENIYSLELFHGPTLAFKDVGARFMARLLGHFEKEQNDTINVLVATSGDTGSAVANGFLDVDGVNVYVLYPKGLVSKIQESQFTTLGKNITALEIDGAFDDCQSLVKTAFMDKELNEKMYLTSANSINVARFLPQSFYYFWGVAQLHKLGIKDNIVCSVPSGNFGNITAGIFGKNIGLPVKRFIAANNENDVFYDYLKTGDYKPRASVATIANAMDVGDPSNFARVYDLFDKDFDAIKKEISSFRYSNEEIGNTMRAAKESTGYTLDPHGATGYQALKDGLQDGETGFFIETAHPAKFKETVDSILSSDIEIPAKLQAFMKGEKQSINLDKSFESFKTFLLNK